MRLCLVEPRWEKVHICNTPEEIRTRVGVRRKCVTMAEDEGCVLAFDPVDEVYTWRCAANTAWELRGLEEMLWGVSSLDSWRKIAIPSQSRAWGIAVEWYMDLLTHCQRF